MSIVLDRDPEWDKADEALKAGDSAGALFVFRKIAHQGYSEAFVQIATIYEIGEGGVEENLELAAKWYKKSVDTQNDDHSRLCLARMFLLLNREADELSEAHSLLISLDGNRGALFGLGMIYDNGLGVEESKFKAMEYYQKAKDAGHLLAAKRLAELMIKNGQVLKGLGFWFKSIYDIFRAVMADLDDPRMSFV